MRIARRLSILDSKDILLCEHFASIRYRIDEATTAPYANESLGSGFDEKPQALVFSVSHVGYYGFAARCLFEDMYVLWFQNQWTREEKPW